MLLSPANAGDVTVRRKNGSDVKNYSLLPSAFFTFEKNGAGVMLFGGGCGHGVGMSQDGVKGMMDAGFGFEDILAHYYPGTVLRKMFVTAHLPPITGTIFGWRRFS